MLTEILDRIEERLDALGLDATNASRQAGLSEDAIRNLRRVVKLDKAEAGLSTITLLKLAPVLETTASWLLEGTHACVERLAPHQRALWDIMINAFDAPQPVQDRIVGFAEFQLAGYEKSREMATKPAE